jgi:hypothetical protein
MILLQFSLLNSRLPMQAGRVDMEHPKKLQCDNRTPCTLEEANIATDRQQVTVRLRNALFNRRTLKIVFSIDYVTNDTILPSTFLNRLRYIFFPFHCQELSSLIQ